MELFRTRAIGDNAHGDSGLLRRLGTGDPALPEMSPTTRLYFLLSTAISLLVCATSARYSRQARVAAS